jgi:type IV secretory pathway VirJ component
MGQLDQVTNQNSGIAHTTATAAEQLSREAESLSGMVGELLSVVNGDKNAKNTPKAVNVAAPKKEIKAQTPKVVEKPKVTLKSVASVAPSTPTDSGLGVPRADDPRFEDL